MSKEVLKQLLADERSEPVGKPEEGLLAKIVNDIGKELKHQAEFGAHEVAAALFRGDAFVMYSAPSQSAEQEGGVHGHGLPDQAKGPEPDKEPEMEL